MEKKQCLNSVSDTAFMQEVAIISRTESMDPEDAFVISKENRQNLKDLLIKLQKEKQLESDSSMQVDSQVLEVFTNILYEALQFVNIIPN
jgi:hypothetical protein